MQAATRIIFNTGALYIKLAVTIFISFYATRIVLNELGAEDYGLYNIVGGIVAMLSFLNTAMANACQRHISVSMGTGNVEDTRKVFANGVVLHYSIGILLLVVFELAGFYFINYFLSIKPDRIGVAQLLLHFVVVSTFLGIISVPYDSLINAKEKMSFLAIVGIFESILKLVAAIYLAFSSFDKLLVYGFLIMVISIVIRMIKRYYCFKTFSEFRIKILGYYDREVIKKLTSFAGWNLFGVICYVLRNQGIAVVLNLFFGTIVNAAYGIANQINGQLSFLSQTMMSTVRPQMMKSEGAGQRERMIDLSIIAGKFSFYFFILFAVPVFIEMPVILNIWLKNTPDNSVIFCRLILILTAIQQLRSGIVAAVQSIGKIKAFELTTGSIQLFTLPLSYLALKFGFPAYSVLVISILTETIASVYRVIYFSSISGNSFKIFSNKIVIKPALPFLTICFTGFLFHLLFQNEIARVLNVFVFSFCVGLFSIYFIGLEPSERTLFNNLYRGIHKKIVATLSKVQFVKS